ncbi:MAG: MucB/RseB C-terminal domain-containing protein [Acidiferrobacterales bacterium]|nr:MucB/RseB C-terminal domain-containing protein [Acidiferrobacterales bacterium]
MSLVVPRALGVISTMVLLSPTVAEAESAYDWLMRMNQATRQLTYDGTFVYQHGDQLEAMRIIHMVDGDSVQERLVSLNGAAREVIRDDRQVTCYLPDRQSAFVEHRLGREKSFPVILPERVKDLKKNYRIQLSDKGRVTGREAQSIIIRPRDEYRYGYLMWADKQSGLLLKADLVDHVGKTLEQFMFTQVDIGRRIEPYELEPAIASEGLAWYWGKTVEPNDTPAAASTWSVEQLPQGFKRIYRIMRKGATRDSTVIHLVYSDGLAAVSVFIEEAQGEKPSMIGASRMGAVHAYGNIVDGRQVIVVGEVPAATVELIGRSVTAKHR